MQSTKTEVTQFAKDVKTGLGKVPKSVPSKYFYDEEGDRIFQQIMEMPEYYLTRCEFEILEKQTKNILEAADTFQEPFNLVEFGAGDGFKTKLLLNYLVENNADFTYHPVDISASILQELKKDLDESIPSLKVDMLNMDYFAALHAMKNLNERRTVILFLGSNIGNFHYHEAADFLRKLANESKEGDMLLLGIDLKKDQKVIVDAYNDPQGITAAFNLNLLTRMNRELGADFRIEDFSHYTFYEKETGEVLSFLKSLKEQKVSVSSIDREFQFGKDEMIHTEISKKYSLKELETIAEQQDFEVINHFLDSKQYFTDTLWRIKK